MEPKLSHKVQVSKLSPITVRLQGYRDGRRNKIIELLKW